MPQVVAEATVPKDRLVTRYADAAGSPAASAALVGGLREGGDFSYTTREVRPVLNADGTPVLDANGDPTTQLVDVPHTITNTNGAMGWGNVNISLSLAQALVDSGEYADLESALAGTTTIVTNPDGTTTSTTSGGVLAMRADGMGWGAIAKELGFKLGSLISAGNKSDQAIAASAAKANAPRPRPLRPPRPTARPASPSASPRSTARAVRTSSTARRSPSVRSVRRSPNAAADRRSHIPPTFRDGRRIGARCVCRSRKFDEAFHHVLRAGAAGRRGPRRRWAKPRDRRRLQQRRLRQRHHDQDPLGAGHRQAHHRRLDLQGQPAVAARRGRSQRRARPGQRRQPQPDRPRPQGRHHRRPAPRRRKAAARRARRPAPGRDLRLRYRRPARRRCHRQRQDRHRQRGQGPGHRRQRLRRRGRPLPRLQRHAAVRRAGLHWLGESDFIDVDAVASGNVGASWKAGAGSLG